MSIPHRIRRQRWLVRTPSQEEAFATRLHLRSQLETALLPVFERAFDSLGLDDEMVHIPHLALDLKLRPGKNFIEALTRELHGKLDGILQEAVVANSSQAGIQRNPLTASRRQALLHYLATGRIEWHTQTGAIENLRQKLRAEAKALVGDGSAFLDGVGNSLTQRATACFRLLQLLPGETRQTLLAHAPLRSASRPARFPDAAENALPLLPVILHQLIASDRLGFYLLLRIQALLLALRKEDLRHPPEPCTITLLRECLDRGGFHSATAIPLRTALLALVQPASGTSISEGMIPSSHSVESPLEFRPVRSPAHMVGKQWQQVPAATRPGAMPENLPGQEAAPRHASPRHDLYKRTELAERISTVHPGITPCPPSGEKSAVANAEPYGEQPHTGMPGNMAETPAGQHHKPFAAIVSPQAADSISISVGWPSTNRPMPEIPRTEMAEWISADTHPDTTPASLFDEMSIEANAPPGKPPHTGTKGNTAETRPGQHHRPFAAIVSPQATDPISISIGAPSANRPLPESLHREGESSPPDGSPKRDLQRSPELTVPNTSEGFMALDAGLVLLHPFLERLFGAAGIAPTGARDLAEPALPRAAAMLHWLLGGREEVFEFELTTVKVLLGLSPGQMLPVASGLLSGDDRAEADHLLASAISHWAALGRTSVAGLRMSFLQRRGLLRDTGQGWQLQVEPESFDVLLGSLPWGIGIVRLPWMTKPIFTEWPAP